MALSPQMSLGEAAKDVILRAGLSLKGNQATNLLPLVYSFIRSAQSELFLMMEWTELYKSSDFTLTSGVSVYDWPDDAMPERILWLTVVRTSDSVELPLEVGIRPYERQSALTSGRPARYDYKDRTIEILPAPDTNYVTARVYYIASPARLVDTGTPLSLDSEAIIQRSLIKLKSHLGMPGVSELAADHAQYLDRLKGQQSNGEGLMLGGHKSWKVRAQRRDRMGSIRYTQQSSDDWHPW